MSVCFAITPCHSGGGIAEDDARRVGMARRVAAARLRYCGLHTLVDDVTLIVSELVTNAIVHSGGTQVTFTMTINDGVLDLTVHDEMPGGPTAHDADHDAERGRGLFLVHFLAEEHGGKWGTSEEGATIWCRLPLAGTCQ
ncbi:ATP-binding protein [Streptomyces sp. NPDC004059]